MKTKTVVISIAILLGILLIAIPFINNKKAKKSLDLPPGTHEVTIKEVIQTTKYTYFLVDENESEYWIAVTKREAAEGDVIYYSNPLEMNNFVSKELGRTFPSIFFVQNVSNEPTLIGNAASQPMTQQKPEIVKIDNVKIKPVKGGISISDLYEEQTKFAGNTVIIRGVVARYNHKVIGKNWVHIQDGTDYSGQFDLAVTTMDSLAVGNTVTFTGTISLNKDYGAGYFYKVIMEEAKASEIVPN
jgi:hypothetical protein